MILKTLRTFALASSLSLALAAGSVALASGPGGGAGNGNGSTGRSTVTLDCAQPVGPVTITVENPDNANGAGQLLDASGHLILVGGTFSVVDVTKNLVLFSGPAGHGSGHQNQDTVECTSTQFVGTDVFGTQLPPGVSSGDTIAFMLDVTVVPML